MKPQPLADAASRLRGEPEALRLLADSADARLDVWVTSEQGHV